MKLPIMLLCAIVLPGLSSCQSITPLPVSVKPPANLVQDCDVPVVIIQGDNIPQALIEQTAKLMDCQDKHKKLAEFCGAK